MKQIRSALLVFLVLTIITGLMYPIFVTAFARIFFPYEASGSLIIKNGAVIGSSLIGQSFEDPKYFWGRLSATSPVPYNASNSSGSNIGPVNPVLRQSIESRMKTLKDADPGNRDPIPVDLVTSSASGLDPHISIAGALYQAGRVARSRGISESVVQNRIRKNTQGRFLGLVGEPVVNVLRLNIALDELKS
ncbi:MAG: potassium-transporting ATPase subunit KdpC [Candidatus Omnitrophica bacterium]|nr:potassium-transporting ATPase subunit KdpC [Candidatus Omnitrophota bacterium]